MSEELTIPVLDKGFVRYIGHFGDDQLIVNAARISYASGTKQVRNDEALIDYLMRHNHSSPFELANITLHIKAPLFVISQMDRHRTQKKNQISARYSVIKDEMYLPEKVRSQDKSNKQMSGEYLPDTVQNVLIEDIADIEDETYRRYQRLLENGVSREQARVVLPQATYSEMYWQMDLRNLFNFLRQRLDLHAQPEIQEYAKVIASITEQLFPVSFAVFIEHQLNSKVFSATEMELIHGVIDAVPEARQYFIDAAKELDFRKTKLNEFFTKLDISIVKE